jgi:hypothetical protein
MGTKGVIEMNLDEIVDILNIFVDKWMVLGLWEFNSLGKNGITGFSFKTMFKINKVAIENGRIKVSVCVELFDAWDMFEQTAEKILINIIKGQLTEKIQGVDDLLDITIVETEGV